MSTVTVSGRTLVPDDLLEFENGKSCELVDGRFVEKPMSTRSQYLGSRMGWILMNYCIPTGLAHVILENSMVCFPSKPNQVRRPDIMVILTARLPFDQIDDGHLKIRPDVAIEVISPGDTFFDIEGKLEDYKDAGIPLVWLVSPLTNRVRVIRLEGPPSDFGLDDEITGESILPGFRCRVADLFNQASA